ncbi:MAG TPA: hypothetical protein VFL72_05540 [Acidimicrobiia bacterium]|nr:hypothetical protein [Acidimicrobiia bacterium]
MAKTTGMAQTALSVDDSAGAAKDIRNDVSDWTFSTPRAAQDITGVDKSAMERQLLLADFSITINGPAFNDSANQAHAVFKTVPSTSVARTVTITITGTVGANTLAPECLFTDYSLNRGSDGSLSWTAPGVLQSGTAPTWS